MKGVSIVYFEKVLIYWAKCIFSNLIKINLHVNHVAIWQVQLPVPPDFFLNLRMQFKLYLK